MTQIASFVTALAVFSIFVYGGLGIRWTVPAEVFREREPESRF